MFNGLPPLSLYIHLPWCVRKCPYCDFNSHQLKGDAPTTDYVEALLTDLEADLPRVWGRTVSTIFIGGGTPSLFPAKDIERLLSGVAARIAIRPGAEVTMEANPGTLESGPLADYRAAGVTRLSLGIQSFNDRLLEKIGRIHSADCAEQAVREALKVGFEGINIDLMFGLPGQTTAEMVADLERALALDPGHISHYQLTLEPNTLFHRTPPAKLPDADLSWEMTEQAHQLLADAGYERYEVSAFARPGQACQHNLNYWRFGDYLGIGAGAHGKITSAAEGSVKRLVKQRHPATYLAGPERVIQTTTLGPDDLVFEFMLGALRLRAGVAVSDFTRRTGLTMAQLEPELHIGVEKGWLNVDAERIAPSELGYQYLNDVQGLFLRDV
ncbi:MAG: radical SAM family heme chaperone HemW [Pseudomonadota bacterium]